MTMQAIVIRIQTGNLLVFDESMSQTVIVHTTGACRFSVGDCVCIRYSGVMTASIPPQITATSISKIRCP